ncbi:MAG: hypothetical protein LBL79_11430 [Prevotella sp.]|jgi:hypothetical protein|nr:hypothetical protein [Prevotella sp.]
MNLRYVYILLIIFLPFSCKKKTQEAELQATVDEYVGDDSEENEYTDGQVDIPVVYSYWLKGNIGGYECRMYLDIDSTSVSGSYSYLNKKGDMRLEGTYNDYELNMTEFQNEIPTGNFRGKFDLMKGIATGTWTSADEKRSLPFEIRNYYGANYQEYKFKTDLQTEVDLDNEYESMKVTTLFVYDKTGKKLLAELGGFESQPLKSTYRLTLRDFNFDGYQDIALMEFIPSYGPDKFLFWLYKPETEDYKQTDILDDVYTLPEINYEDSTTVTTTIWHNRIHTQTYKFNGSKWILKDSSSEDEDGGE